MYLINFVFFLVLISKFSEVRSGSVLENENPGTHVMQVRAFYSDGVLADNKFTFEIGDPSDLFAIDSITGNVTTLKMFDREERSFYNITIIATDNSESALNLGKHNTAQQVFLIEIADENDNPPFFTQDTYVESIAENANINELVTVVRAVDIDTTSVVAYSIVAGNTYDAFVIGNFTGEIRVNSELDYENITSYSLDVRAFDGIYEDYAKVIINIENLNDSSPVLLNNYTNAIEEETFYESSTDKINDTDALESQESNAMDENLDYTDSTCNLEIGGCTCVRSYGSALDDVSNYKCTILKEFAANLSPFLAQQFLRMCETLIPPKCFSETPTDESIIENIPETNNTAIDATTETTTDTIPEMTTDTDTIIEMTTDADATTETIADTITKTTAYIDTTTDTDSSIEITTDADATTETTTDTITETTTDIDTTTNTDTITEITTETTLRDSIDAFLKEYLKDPTDYEFWNRYKDYSNSY